MHSIPVKRIPFRKQLYLTSLSCGRMGRNQRQSRGRESQHLISKQHLVQEQVVDNVEILAEHSSLVRISRSFNKSEKIKREYMNRVKRMLNWVKEFYPGHYEQVCYDLSEQDKKDVNRFYHSNEQDFKYNLDLC